MSADSAPLENKPDTARRRVAPAVMRLALILIGVAGGVVGFWGYFVNFVNYPHHPHTGLYLNSSVWFDLIPISIGLGTIGLALPRALRVFTSGLPLLAMGIAFSIRGIFGDLITNPFVSSWGYGFYMISVGSGVVTLASLLLVATSAQQMVVRRAGDEDRPDLAMPEPEDLPLGNKPDNATPRATLLAALPLILALIGLAGGVVGFWGFFINFFHYHSDSALSRFSSVWFDLILVSIGLGTIDFALPGILRAFTSGFSLLALGIAFGIHGLFQGPPPIRPCRFMEGVRVPHDLRWIWRPGHLFVVTGCAIASVDFEATPPADRASHLQWSEALRAPTTCAL